MRSHQTARTRGTARLVGHLLPKRLTAVIRVGASLAGTNDSTPLFYSGSGPRFPEVSSLIGYANRRWLGALEHVIVVRSPGRKRRQTVEVAKETMVRPTSGGLTPQPAMIAEFVPESPRASSRSSLNRYEGWGISSSIGQDRPLGRRSGGVSAASGGSPRSEQSHETSWEPGDGA